MVEKYIKTFKIEVNKKDGSKKKYLYKFNVLLGGKVMAEQFFYIYKHLNLPRFSDELNNEGNLNEDKIKENQNKYLQAVNNFVSNIKVVGDTYCIENINVSKPTTITGLHNNNYLDVDKGDVVNITSPNLKDIEDDEVYKFERNLSDYNLYKKLYFFDIYRENHYLYHNSKFTNKLEKLTEKLTNKFKRVNDKSIKEKLIIKPLLKNIESLDHIYTEEKLLKIIYNNDLSINKYSKIDEFVKVAKQVMRLSSPNIYNDSVLQIFKDYINENKYLQDLYLKSISKKELFKLFSNAENNKLNLSRELEKSIIYEFWQNNSKEIIKMFVKNSILSKPKN